MGEESAFFGCADYEVMRVIALVVVAMGFGVGATLLCWGGTRGRELGDGDGDGR